MPLGDFGEVEPPVTISNTEVKRLSAHDTAFARMWENRSLPEVFDLLMNRLNRRWNYTR